MIQAWEKSACVWLSLPALHNFNTTFKLLDSLQLAQPELMAEDNQEQTRSFQNDFTYIKTMRCS
jgi:hypothetical protein